MKLSRTLAMALPLFFLVAAAYGGTQSASNAGSIGGTVTDNTGAAIPGATVTVLNPVSQFTRTVQSDAEGRFTITNVPFNNYHVTASAPGFAQVAQDVNVHTSIPQAVVLSLQPGAVSETVNVQSDAGDLIENDSTFHTDIDQKLISKIPLESNSSAISSLVTLATPGITADSNGLFHGLGDHAENSFSVDGQPITDQQSKVFSNQIPLSSVQSLQVISGAPPANYGDKTSVVIDVTTKSGLGVTPPSGSIFTSYGSFGTTDSGFNLSAGTPKYGNFISADASQSGRFLDPPEFAVMHDKGNEENLFDRFDDQVRQADTLHLNFNYTRSWFQTPNSFDAQRLSDQAAPFGTPLSPTDQRSKIETVNIGPAWTHIFSPQLLVNSGLFMRRDSYNYFPSNDPFADFQPGGEQSETVSQQRSLLNSGVRSEAEYSRNHNDIKLGGTYTQTFLDENFNIGVVDPLLNAPCIDGSGNPVPGFNNPAQCVAAGYFPNNGSGNVNPFNPLLACFDLTRPTPAPGDNCALASATQYTFNGHTDVKELALYGLDNLVINNWSFNLGIRGDFYNGLTRERQAEPRLGAAYNVKRTNTVLRVSYARTLETPFNENLVLSSVGCANPVLNPLLLCSSRNLQPLNPGLRNEFHAGFEQAIGKHFVASAEWISKYTHNAFDFSVLGNTPIAFPIEWHNSKIPGYAGRISVTDVKGFSLLTTFSSVAARFFNPQVGGAGATPGQVGVFRIDHDEKFNQTTHLQYQPKPDGPWLGFNWRFDSGLVAGAVPCYGVMAGNDCPQSTTLGGQPAIDLSAFTADQEFQAGFYCGSQKATPYDPLPSVCLASQFGSSLIHVPAPNTQNDDHNPARISPHSLFDLALGDDNIFHSEGKRRWAGQVTVVNMANEYSPYNFLSTFSGTHYITPRTVTGQITYNF